MTAHLSPEDRDERDRADTAFLVGVQYGRQRALVEAAHYYGAIWGSGETTEARVSEVLRHWALHGVGARMPDPS